MAGLRKRTIVAGALIAVAAGTSGAQQPAAGGKWQAWIGCWLATPTSDNSPTVCITPTSSNDAVAVTTMADGKVVNRDTLDASGRERAVTTLECGGVKVGTWSGDERRVYLRSTVTCGNLRTATSSILALTAAGEWLDIRGMSAGGGEGVRVARYQPTPVPDAAPSDIQTALSISAYSSPGARIAAGAPIGTAAVIEAAKSVDVAVAEAWILERGQVFPLDGATLIRLADAGLPARISDAMVAVSNPSAFAFARPDARQSRGDVIETDAPRRIYVNMEPTYDPWGYGYSQYGSGFGYPSYGSGYGRYGGYGSGYYPPIIIGGNPSATDVTPRTRGRAVKGQGYTETERASGSAQSSGSRGESSSGASSGSSSGASSSTPSSSGTTQRTAKPRP